MWESEEGDKKWEKQLSKGADSLLVSKHQLRFESVLLVPAAMGLCPSCSTAVGLMGEGHQQACGEEMVG